VDATTKPARNFNIQWVAGSGLVLEELGIRPLINCTGNETVLGGTTVDDSVIEAMKEVAKVFVDMEELHRKAGEYLSRLLRCEDAFITNGAQAGLLISVAACMCKGDLKEMLRLPDTNNVRNEVIIQRLHRNMYDYNVRFTGCHIVEIGTNQGTSKDDLERAINEKTGAILYVAFDPLKGVLPLNEVSRIAHSYGIPVIVDAAAELPPVENFKKFLESGADLVLFSGGKDIGAPNDTGLIIGRKDLIEACRLLGPQSYREVDSQTRVFLGRPMKVSKEDIFAFIQALKNYLRTDHHKRLASWERRATSIMSKLAVVDGVKVRKIYSGTYQPRPVCVPKVEVELTSTSKLTAEQIVVKLRHCATPIATYSIEGKLYINPQCLKDGEEETVLARLLELLK
jgi:L-seryl-tRNA(Ser) seleniumtransferase